MFLSEKIIDIVKAQVVCVSCPVFNECDEWRELTQSNWGVWAGRYYTPKATD